MSTPKPVGGLAPPPGVTPNFDNPPQEVPAFFLVLILCLAFSTVFICMRLYVRNVIAKPMYWDDYFSLAGWMGLVGYVGLGFQAIKNGGAGVDQWNLPIDTVMRFAQYANDANIIYGVLNTLIRLSIAFLLRRLFVVEKTWNRINVVLHIIIWFNVLLYSAHTFIMIFACNPRERIWDLEVPGHCVNLYALFTFTSVVNLITDLTFLILPLREVWRLQMQWKRKLGVLAVFCVGLLSLASTVVRMVFTIAGASNPNQTVAETTLWLWVYVELTAAHVVGCMPVVPALLNRIISSLGLISSIRSKDQSGSGPSKENSKGHVKGNLSGPWHGRHIRADDDDTFPFSTLRDAERGETGYELSPQEGRNTTRIEGGSQPQGQNKPRGTVSVLREFKVTHA